MVLPGIARIPGADTIAFGESSKPLSEIATGMNDFHIPEENL